jgi:hypothetical protein
MTGSSPVNDENYPGFSSPLTGMTEVGVNIVWAPHSHPLPPVERGYRSYFQRNVKVQNQGFVVFELWI